MIDWYLFIAIASANPSEPPRLGPVAGPYVSEQDCLQRGKAALKQPLRESAVCKPWIAPEPSPRGT